MHVLLKLWSVKVCLPGRGFTPAIYILYRALHTILKYNTVFILTLSLKSVNGHSTKGGSFLYAYYYRNSLALYKLILYSQMDVKINNVRTYLSV